MQDNVREFKLLLEQLGDTYERKNSDYGSAIEKGIEDLGFIYSVCQLYNKFMRFQNLVAKDDFSGKVGESLMDTLLDMAVYAVETARVMDNYLQYMDDCEDSEYDELDI